MSKVIFLDIDGPMIPYRCRFLTNQTSVMTLFDPVAVSLLNGLCEELDCKIVLHTSWLQIMGSDYTLKHCIAQGLKAEHFHQDACCKEDFNWRYTRVAEWLNRHPEVVDYAIVDDDGYNDDLYSGVPYRESLCLHLVLVNYYEGFLYSTYNNIRKVLNELGFSGTFELSD